MRYTATVTPISRGARGTKTTLRAMERLVEAGIRDPEVVLFAQEQVRNSPEYGKTSEIEAILAAVRRSMRYTPDPLGVETVKDPTFIVREIKQKGRAAMDCDDASVLAAALLRAVGIPTRFKVIKDSPTEYTHVYLEAFTDPGWVKIDPIAREMSLGKAPEGRFGSAYYEGGRMYRGMGAADLSTTFGNALDTFVAYQTDRFTKQPTTTTQPNVIRTMQPMAAPSAGVPWGKIAMVAGIGLGAIFAFRMLKKRR